jgi:subtilisin family serine protease
MVQHRADWRCKTRRVARALAIAALPLACLDGAAVHAQSVMGAPPNNLGSRVPSIDTTSRINPNIGRIVTGIERTTPRLAPACSYAYRDSAGECQGQPVRSAGGGGGTSGGGGGSKSVKNKNDGPRRNTSLTALNLRAVANELVAEIDGSLTDAQADELARRHRLERIASQNFPLVGGTIGLFRIVDRRPVDTVRRELAADARVRSVQPNFRYLLQDQKVALTEGDPAQYAVAKLRLPQAHTLAHGANVTIAVIDSGIDIRHPELANAIADSFDALGSKEGPHVHGTGIAGAIVSHARLMGSAPAARILAIRAFGVAPSGAQSTSFVILKGLDYAAAHGAQIVNMSFAGPKDALIERGIAAAAAKGIVMVAAAGNAGPKSPPLYPAANASVIAVSATDAQDRLFAASNRGGHIAVAAPGVDIFLPAPDEKYQMTSGTSFSAAYVSGLAALMLERNPALKSDEVRAILMKTARDLGSPGRDDLFGAGEVDAFAAVSAVTAAPAVPVAAVSGGPAAEKASDRQEVPVARDLNPPAAAMASDNMASDKSAVHDADRPAAR